MKERAAVSTSSRPNLILIVADQWRGDCLSGIGSRHPVMTPHVTQLGCEGTRFGRAYADCPVCMPQRVTHLTGQVASRFGQCGNFTCRSPVDSGRSLPARLAREAGYQTKAVGKMHFEPSRARMGFEHVTLHPNDYAMFLEENGYGGMYRGHGLGGNELYPAVSAVPERFSHTHWIVDESIRFLYQRDPECPFFLYIVFEAPHSPFDPPEPYDRMYDTFEIPEPVCGDWVGTNEPPGFRCRVLSKNSDHLTPEMIRESRRRYYGQVSHIDYQLGRLFGELKTRGLWNDTAVCFTSDHGEFLGDHGLWAKSTYLAGSADVPLQVKWPEGVCGDARATTVSSPALTADIAPTLLELAGLAPDGDMDGVSLLGQTNDSEPRIVCGELGDNAFASDGAFKYIWYAGGGVEHLFDEVNDPENLHDLSADNAHTETKAGLRHALIKHLSRFDRPLVENGNLKAVSHTIDEQQSRSANPMAWRGPMRYGQGYHGWKG